MKSVAIGGLPVGALIIFYFTLFFTACREQQPALQKQVVVFWKDGKATGLIFTEPIFVAIPEDSISEVVIIRLAGQDSQQAIEGDYSIKEGTLWFEPLIPFTRGLRYEVYVSDSLFHEFQIPQSEETPKLVAIYPSQDTLPENLLKIYLVFSKPMAATRSLRHVLMKNQQGDTLQDVFLDLQQELWNAERTVLTLWVNPGRVRRELQPNQQMGAPLERGRKYMLVVSGEWRDAEGKALNLQSRKDFVAADRDAVSPSPDNWKLQLPKRGTTGELQVVLDEPLDYFLLKNTIKVVDSFGNDVGGSLFIVDEEKKFRFKPDRNWSAGLYRLKIEARLEDLAGNNLNRPFDRDLQNKQVPVNDKILFEKKWRISNSNN